MRAILSAGQFQLARRLSASAAGSPLGASAPSLAAVLASPFTYRAALVRGLSPAFAASARRGAAAEIDQARAAAQHAAYVSALKQVIPRVIELPAADGCADSVFVEDTAVVLGGVALVTAPGAASRAAETAAVESSSWEGFVKRNYLMYARLLTSVAKEVTLDRFEFEPDCV